MVTLRRFWLALVFLSLAPGWAAAEGSQAISDRSLEASLLHRRINLSGLEQWNRSHKSWHTLPGRHSKLLVLNIWSHSCQPCKQEFPMFRRMVASWQAHKEVQFLFIADPPDETSQADVEQFWAKPLIELRPGQTCDGSSFATGSRQMCVLKLPELDPVRSTDTRLLKSVGEVTVRPLTLLVDSGGLIRQVFAGSVDERRSELSEAITRLLAAL